MENCLVTKLKSVVNNDNLYPLGKIEVYHFANDAYLLSKNVVLQSEKEVELTVDGGNFVDANGNSLGTTYRLPANSPREIRTSNSDCVVQIPCYYLNRIEISEEYYIRFENLYSIGVNSVNPITLIIKSPNRFGNIFSVPTTKLFRTFSTENDGYVIDFTNIRVMSLVYIHAGESAQMSSGEIILNPSTSNGVTASVPNATFNFSSNTECVFNNINVRGTNGGGDVDLLTFKSTISTIDMPKGVTGRVESIVEKLWAANKRDGRTLLSCYDGATLTLNGVANKGNIDRYLVFTSSDAKITSVNGATTYATYDGRSWTYSE